MRNILQLKQINNSRATDESHTQTIAHCLHYSSVGCVVCTTKLRLEYNRFTCRAGIYTAEIYTNIFNVIMAIILISVGKCICTMKTFDFSLLAYSPATSCPPARSFTCSLHSRVIISILQQRQHSYSGSNKQLCMKMNESTELFTM